MNTGDNSAFASLPMRRPTELENVSVAVIGAAAASPYQPGQPSHAAAAPAALRAASMRFAPQLAQFDFDLDGVLCPSGGAADLVDCGDIATDPADPAGNRGRITAAIRDILAAGAAPLVLGGDDSVPIPVFQALHGLGPVTVLQIDAHVDWGDVIQGNPFGYGSTMRRTADLPWITGMVQVGLRGLGSGTADQLHDARAWGSRLITARTVRQGGVNQVLAHIPDGAQVFASIDCDGLDPSVMPAVNMPTPGGLFYDDVVALLQGVAGKARLIGCNLVEFVPRLDRDGLAALLAARLAAVAMGLMRKAGRDPDARF